MRILSVLFTLLVTWQPVWAQDFPREMVMENDAEDVSGNPEAVLAKAQDDGYLDKLLDELPFELRECIVLRELEELSYREIADITAVHMGTVMSRLWRARKLLMQAGRREQ